MQFLNYPKNNLERIIFASAFLILSFGLLTAGICAWLMMIGYSPTPYADQWAILWDFARGAKWFSPSWLWQQHSEHRIPLVRLAVYLDFRWFGDHGFLLFSLIFLTLSAHWAMWALFVRKAVNLPRVIWMGVAGFLAFCIFCPSQTENLYWGLQWTFVAAFFFSSASFIALSWFAPTKPWHAVGFASLAAFLAESSLASGLVTWPVLWLGMLALPLRRRHRLVLASAGVVAIAVYVYHFHGTQVHSDPVSSLRQPAQVGRYVIRYIDHCLSYYFVHPGIAAGALSAIAFAALIFLLRRPNTHALGLSLAMTMCFVLGTGLITALGRLKFGIEQATASRYQGAVMLYWGCAFTALTVAAWQLRSWRDVLALNAAALAVMLLPLRNLKPLGDEVHARAERFSVIGESLDRGVLDPALQDELSAGPWAFIPGTIYLHQHGDLVGLHPPDLSISTTQISNLDRGACEGYLDAVSRVSRFEPGPPVVRADGWALDSRRHRPADAIAIIDDRGTLLAVTSFHLPRPDVLHTHAGAEGLPGWRIYVPLPPTSKQLRAVAITGGHDCPLTNMLAVAE
jgi:hypothetical protein